MEILENRHALLSHYEVRQFLKSQKDTREQTLHATTGVNGASHDNGSILYKKGHGSENVLTIEFEASLYFIWLDLSIYMYTYTYIYIYIYIYIDVHVLGFEIFGWITVMSFARNVWYHSCHATSIFTVSIDQGRKAANFRPMAQNKSRLTYCK